MELSPKDSGELAGYRLLAPSDVATISRVARQASERFIGIDHSQTVSLTLGRVARILARVGTDTASEILANPGYLYAVTERQARKVAKKLAGAGGLRGKTGGADMERVEGSPNYSPFTGEPVRKINAVGKLGKTSEPMAVGHDFGNPGDLDESFLSRATRADIATKDLAILAAAVLNASVSAPIARPSLGAAFLPYADVVADLSAVGIKTDYHAIRVSLTRTLKTIAGEDIGSMRARLAAGERHMERTSK